MKFAYSYRRFSSSGQASGSSLERQLEIAQEVCTENSWKLLDLPPDKGISGFKSANVHKGALGIFLKKVKAGEITKGSVLIIEKMDRFSRNEVDIVLPDFINLLQSGIEIYSYTDKNLYTLALIRSNPMLLNYALMAMAMANDFSKTLSGRITKTFNLTYMKAKKGEAVKFGAWQPKWIDLVDGCFKLNDKANIVKRIYAEYMSGNSMVKIAKGLITDNIQPIGGGKTWTQSQIAYFLKTETLIGNITIKNNTFTKYYPVILTDNEWHILQSKLNDNTIRKGGRKKSSNIISLFPNRIFCSKCNGHVNSHISTNGKGGFNLYYKCTGARYGLCDCRKMIRIEGFELDFFLCALFKEPKELLTTKESNINDDINQLNFQRDSITKKINKLALVDDIDIEEFKETANKLKNERNIIDNNILILKEKQNSYDNFKPALDNLKDTIDLINIEESLKDINIRKNLLQIIPSIVNHVTIDLMGKSYKIHFVNGKTFESPLSGYDIETNDYEEKERLNKEFESMV